MARKVRLPALAAAFICSVLPATDAVAKNVCEREMARAARTYDVPLGVLYAVGLTETGRKGSLQPFAMNIEGAAYLADSVSAALVRFEAAAREGAKLINVGCMQINHHYHSEKFRSLEDMFDPHRNVDYAARFLNELKAREGSWTLAVARYHAGPNNNPAQKCYVCAVIRNMVETGFAEWTENARAFCG